MDFSGFTMHNNLQLLYECKIYGTGYLFWHFPELISLRKKMNVSNGTFEFANDGTLGLDVLQCLVIAALHLIKVPT